MNDLSLARQLSHLLEQYGHGLIDGRELKRQLVAIAKQIEPRQFRQGESPSVIPELNTGD